MRRSRVILVLLLVALIVGSSLTALVVATSSQDGSGSGGIDSDAYGAGYLSGRALRTPQTASPSASPSPLVNTAEPNTFDRWCEWGMRAVGADAGLDTAGRADFMTGCRDALHGRSPKVEIPSGVSP